jgi:hypothetical protein
MHRLATVAALPPPDDTALQWYVSIGDTDAAVETEDMPEPVAISDSDTHNLSPILVVLEDAGDVLTLSATLGTALRAHPAHFWRHLLSVNAALLAADRGAITIDSAGHTIYLTQALDGTAFVAHGIAAYFETFVAQARHLIDVLNKTLPLDHAEAEKASTGVNDGAGRPMLSIQA